MSMTGRDLIIYILENGLEDEPLYKDGHILGFMTEAEAANKFGVGIATVKAWVVRGALDGVKIGNQIYIPANSKNPMERKNNEISNSNLRYEHDCDIANDARTRAMSALSAGKV